AVLGHSAGEYVAACIAGVLSLEDGLRLIVERGRRMQQCPEGAMLACFASLDELQRLIEPWGNNVAIAALNGPQNTVIASECDEIMALRERLSRAGIVVKELRGNRAFHSRLIEPALDGLQQAAQALAHHSPAIPLISNLTGDFFKMPPDA